MTFARPQGSAEEHAAAAAAMAAGGYATVTSTVLGDRPALRLCTINPLTTESEIEETVKRLADAVS